MMTKFFKKWSASLVFAILLHLGIILLFYINSYENRTNNIDHSQEFIEDTAMSTKIEKDYLSTMAQSRVTTLNPAEKDDGIDYTQDRNLGISKEHIEKTEEKIPGESLKIVNSTPIYFLKSETISNQSLQENNKKLENQQSTSVTLNSFYDDNLVNVNDDIGLLNIDKPIRSSKPQIDRNYDLVKSEIEETNDQLSDAINEVKKRNQQKIDGIQQQNEYIHNIENNDLAISSSE